MAKKIFVGKVVSDKMTKTVVIEIVRHITHPIYKKKLKRSTRIKADIGEFKPNVGSVVKIEQAKPMSRDKSFKVIEIMQPKGGK